MILIYDSSSKLIYSPGRNSLVLISLRSCINMYRSTRAAYSCLATSSVQFLSCVPLFVTQWTAIHQAFLSITNSWSLLKLMSIELVMTSNHLILCRPLLFLPSIFPRIRVFSNESVLHIRWLKYWSFSFSISPSNEYSGLFSFGLLLWLSW